MLTCRSEFGADQLISSGHGPERGVLQQAIQMLTEDQTLWVASQDGSGWARPVFSPALSPEHELRWKTTGTLLLLHLLTLGNGPEPVSPILLYLLLTAASLRGERSLLPSDTLISLESLYQLDPGIADTLRPWMVLKETDRLSGFTGDRVHRSMMSVQSVLNQCEHQVYLTSHYS